MYIYQGKAHFTVMQSRVTKIILSDNILQFSFFISAQMISRFTALIVNKYIENTERIITRAL